MAISKRKKRDKTKALRRLTFAEKSARGAAPFNGNIRTVKDVQADIAELVQTVEEIQYSAKEAAKAIRKLGVLIPSGRGAAGTHKPNPAVRIHAWALTTVIRLKRQLVLLREEEQLALGQTLPDNDEFAGL